MNNRVGLADGMNEQEALIADIEAWEDNRIHVFLAGEPDMISQIFKSEVEASKLLKRAKELL